MSENEYGNEAAEKASMEMEWKNNLGAAIENMRASSYTNDQLDNKENKFNGALESI